MIISSLRTQGARTGKLKPSLRTISIASVPLLIAENYLQIPCHGARAAGLKVIHREAKDAVWLN